MHLALCTLSDFPCMRNLSGLNDLNSLNNLSGLNDLNSLISSKNLTELDVSFNSGTKLTYHSLSMWDNSPKIPYFVDF
jgi:Leucine-rich repeat (LRR) protein